MSRQTARLVLDQFHLRPALIAQRYSGATEMSFADARVGEVTSIGLLGDVRELAMSNADTEIARARARRQEIASAYGYADTADKPFVFADGKAIIPIHGVLINRFPYSWSFATGYNFIRSQVEAASADPDVDGIVYDVNSYGGLVAGCQETSNMIYAASKKGGGKPSLAVVDANCYSAAYMLMAGADAIAVTPTGGAGSIGVVLMHMDVSSALDKFGVKVTFLFAGDHKVDGNMFQPLSKEVIADLQAELDKMYDKFVGTVTHHRTNLSDKAVRDTQARCYLADEALALGLIDSIETPPDALERFFNAEEAEDGDDDPEPEQNKENDMATEPVKTAAPTGPTAEQAAADATAAATAARTAERARVKAIQTCPEAEGRAELATHLAMETDMTPEAAAGILKASPKAAATPPAKTETTEQNHFKNAMDNGKQPNAGSDGKEGTGDGKPTRAEQILAAQRQSQGIREKAVVVA